MAEWIPYRIIPEYQSFQARLFYAERNMFFTHELLIGPDAKFSIIWLAAMHKDKIKRRQLDRIDISDTCTDLIKYIHPTADLRMARVQGFSLRLSAQLVHGIVVFYDLKVDHLLKEALSSWKWLARSKVLLHDIDLPRKRKKSRGTGSAATENFQLDIDFNDPMFGRMDLDNFPDIPPPNTTTDETSSRSSTEETRLRSRHVVADLAQITLPEELPSNLTEGDPLAHVLDTSAAEQYPADFIRNLMDVEAEDAAPLFDVGRERRREARKDRSATLPDITTPAEAVRSRADAKTPATPRRERTRDLPEEKSPLAVPIERDITRDVIPEELEQPEVIPAPEPAEMLPTESVTSGSLVLDPVEEVAPADRRRKQRKLAVDGRVELSNDEMRKRLGIPFRTAAECREEGFLGEPINVRPVEELFSTPCSISTFPEHREQPEPFMGHASIEDLFRRTARALQQKVPADPVDTSFHAHRVLDQTSAIQVERGEDPRLESTIEIARESLLPGSRSMLQESIEVGSKGMTSIIDQEAVSMDETSSHIPDARPQSPMLPSDFLDAVTAEPEGPSVLDSNLFGDLQMSLEEQCEDGQSTFFQFAPPSKTSRAEAAKKFYGLLTMAKSGVVILRQDVPYGPILMEMSQAEA